MSKSNEVVSKPYKMPDVRMGDTVLWHDSLGVPPTAMAFVTAVGKDTLSLAVLGPGYHNFLVKEGVRHINHPEKDMIRHADVGVWDYTERHKLNDYRLEMVEDLIAPEKPISTKRE